MKKNYQLKNKLFYLKQKTKEYYVEKSAVEIHTMDPPGCRMYLR